MIVMKFITEKLSVNDIMEFGIDGEIQNIFVFQKLEKKGLTKNGLRFQF